LAFELSEPSADRNNAKAIIGKEWFCVIPEPGLIRVKNVNVEGETEMTFELPFFDTVFGRPRL
jgi:hypothetical protein